MGKIFLIIKSIIVLSSFLVVCEYGEQFLKPKEQSKTIEYKIEQAKKINHFPEKMVYVAESFSGVPYNYSNTSYFDSTEITMLHDKDFIENCVAISLTSTLKKGDINLYKQVLQKISLRQHNYTQKIDYFINWKNLLQKKGVVVDLSEYYDGQLLQNNRLEKIFYIPPFTLSPENIRDGDVIAIIKNEQNIIDIAEIAIVKKIKENIHLIYVSKYNGVILSPFTLHAHLNHNPSYIGIILLRGCKSNYEDF